MFTYLFEAKSIQGYIFKNGILRDLISASERLDRLVDEVEHSTLNMVISALDLESNLLKPDLVVTGNTIGFIRAKGGAFYAFCENPEPLQKLRSLWSLTVMQLFPGLEFVDALADGDNLAQAIEKGHQALAANRNSPAIKFPIGTAITNNDSRSGLTAVPISNKAKTASRFHSGLIDLDTEHHRQAYGYLELRHEGLLGKFVNDELLETGIRFPLDTDDFPSFKAADNPREVVKDLALIHIDGNGLGLILRALQAELKDKSAAEYSQAFREFSTALGNATKKAAQKASKWLFDQQEFKDNEKKVLAFRPIVLGGDDVTLLCQANLALGYTEVFCESFKQFSKEELKDLHKKHLSKTQIKKYLTASAGVLYHKASHPFVTCHQLVEGLCQEAKQLTKKVDPNVGPASVAFYRISNVLSQEISDLRLQTQAYELEEGEKFFGSQGGYLLEGSEEINSLHRLKMLSGAANKSGAGNNKGITTAKFRQMETELARGNKGEADRIYKRALDAEKNGIWLSYPWDKNPNASYLSDLLIYGHFHKESSQEVPNE